KSVFSRFIEDDGPKKERLPGTIPRGPLLQPIVPPADHNSPPIEQLLHFLINRWSKPSVRVRDICRFGPNSVRNRAVATAMTETLATFGWLSPIKTRRIDMREWQIVRGTNR